MTAPAAEPRRAPRDATEALNLPAVEAEHLDRVLRAAGPMLLPALAVLIQAVGWLVATSIDRRVRAVLLAGIPGAIADAARRHDRAGGVG